MYFIVLTRLFIFLFFLVAPKTYADLIGKNGFRYVYTTDSTEVREVLALIDMGEPIGLSDEDRDILSSKLLKESKTVVTLADGFGFNKDDHPISGHLRKHSKKGTLVYKTGFDGPDRAEKPGKLKRLFGNYGSSVIELKVNHQKKITVFKENEVDMVLMRKGLCHCNRGDSATTTCCGLRMNQSSKDTESTDAQLFLFGVASMLNKKNPHSFAFLHGSHLGQAPPELESGTQNTFEGILKQIQHVYPALELRMLYVERPLDKTKYSSTEAAPQVSGVKVKEGHVPEFIGIQMKIRSSESDDHGKKDSKSTSAQ